MQFPRRLIRAGLLAILDQVEDLDVIGSAVNGEEGIRLAEQMKPDVILMDVGMPVVDGIEAAKRIRASGG
jgi:YesN/AraC family two-component response regulator